MIYGNKDIQESLNNCVVNNNLKNSYILNGIDGIGKMTIAKAFAKKILCLKKDDMNCNCISCRSFDNSSNLDYIEIIPDGKSVKIEQIRNFQKEIIERPQISNYKVVIIDQSNKMTKEAQNALLKTLEEPPSYVIIILICTQLNQLLDTIKSRCIIYNFKQLEDSEIKDYITDNKDSIKKEFKDLDLDNLNIDYSILNGSIKNYYNYLKNYNMCNNFEIIFDNINKISYSKYLTLSKNLYENKDDIEVKLNFLNSILLKQLKKTSNFAFSKCILIVEEIKNRLKQKANFDMAIDKLLFDIWEEIGEKFSRG